MSTIEVNKPQIVDCPNCKGKFELEVKQKVPKVVIEQEEKTEIRETSTHVHDKPRDPHDELAKIMPKGINFAKCANGNCGEKIKNSNQITKFKSCPNCNSNSVPKSSDFCPTCGKDSEEWDDSDVEIEEE